MFTSRSAKIITKFTYTVIKNEIAFTESFNKVQYISYIGLEK